MSKAQEWLAVRQELAEAGKAAIMIRNELDRTRVERDSWKSQFEAASAAASEYSEFWEQHNGDFDMAGNYIPHSQIDGDLRAAKAKLDRTRDVLSWLDERGKNSTSYGSHADAYEVAARKLREATA
jgi:hypothetical protein